MTLTHGISWLVIVLGVIAVVRWSWHRSPVIGACILAGALARTIAGFVLFWISASHLPVMANLQLGHGFWVLALDGMNYYDVARIAAEQGLSTISPAGASPSYVRLLALALRVCGESPLTAVLLNVTAYALSCAIVVLMWPRHATGNAHRARMVAVVALSFSPTLLLAATQPLKDQVFVCLVVAAIACVHLGLMAITAAGPDAPVRGLIAVSGTAAAVYVISGMRAYYGLLIVLVTAAVVAGLIAVLPLRRWALHLASTAAVTALLWTAFTYGAGPYATPYRQFVWAALGIPLGDTSFAETVAPFDQAREGFVESGGDTNTVRRHTLGANRTVERLKDVAVGMIIQIVPISILRGLSIVNFDGGRGLLVITDLDTVFLDLTIAIQLCLLWRRQAHREVAFLMFTFAVATAAMMLMAYVVTNYGTMFRLRSMYAIPLWLSGATVVTTSVRSRAAPVRAAVHRGP